MPNSDFLEIRYMDKVLEANYSLWNALLTVNAFMLTAFSAFAVVVPGASKAIILFFVVCCLASASLLVRNYLELQEFYRSCGEQIRRGVLPGDKERKAEVATAADMFKAVRHRQQGALWLLLVEAAFVIALLVGWGR